MQTSQTSTYTFEITKQLLQSNSTITSYVFPRGAQTSRPVGLQPPRTITHNSLRQMPSCKSILTGTTQGEVAGWVVAILTPRPQNPTPKSQTQLQTSPVRTVTGEVRHHSGSRKMLSAEAADRETAFTPKVRPAAVAYIRQSRPDSGLGFQVGPYKTVNSAHIRQSRPDSGLGFRVGTYTTVNSAHTRQSRPDSGLGFQVGTYKTVNSAHTRQSRPDSGLGFQVGT